MASWKVKGYVSDSEDEELDISIYARQKQTVSEKNRAKDNNVIAQIGNKQAQSPQVLDQTIENSSSSSHPSHDENIPINSQLLPEVEVTVDVLEAPIAFGHRSRDLHSHVGSHLKSGTRISQKSLDPADELDDSHCNDADAQPSWSSHEARQAATNPIQSSRTAVALEAKIREGLSLVRDALSCSQSPRAPSLSDEDSPLSTLPDSPNVLSVDQTAPQDSNLPIDSPTLTVHPQRTFRQRNAIQQNPYTLEFATYSKTLADRGLRPIRVQMADAARRARAAEDSQSSMFEASSQHEEQDAHDSMDLDLSNSISSDSDPLLGPDDELPDLEDILHGKFSKSDYSGIQQSKVDGPKKQTVGTTSVYDLPSDNEQPSRMPHSMAKNQDSFPTPPRSTSDDSVQPLPLRQTISRAASPETLPTPLLSSAMRPRKRPVIDDESQSIDQDEAPRLILPSDLSETSSSEGEEQNEDDSEKIRTMQKEVRGVLPASWLSINRAQQELDAKRREAVKARARPRQEPGVAQVRCGQLRKAGDARPPQSTMFEDLISEGEETDNSQAKSNSKDHISADMGDVRFLGSVPLYSDEVMEAIDGDGLDLMLSSRPRSKSIKKKQVRIDGYVQESNHRKLYSGALHHEAQPRHAKTVRQPSTKRRKRKQSRNVVRVTDAPGLQSLERHHQPAFLRLAARQAKQLPRDIDSTASGKFFNFDLDDDEAGTLHDSRVATTNSAQNEIRCALDELINHHAYHAYTLPSSRKAKQIASGSYQRPATPHSCAAQGTHTSSSFGTEIVSPGYPIKNQSERIVTEAEEARELRLTRLRSLLPLTNRSGHGRFASTAPGPRLAQLEVPEQDYSGLSRIVLRRSMPVFPGSGYLQQRHRTPARQEPNVQASEEPNQQPKEAHNHQPIARRPRKQPPRQAPALQQTVPAPIAPDTNALQSVLSQSGEEVRKVLEKEFKQHQAAWFQGSGSTVVIANQNTQNHFQLFLHVLRSYVPTALQDVEGSEAQKLRSFLHRLIPNRGQIGAQGQIGDKVFEVLEWDVLVARNVFDLHICLLNLAPGCAPRPRVLEMKVDFSHAHHEICLIALSAWQDIFNLHQRDTDILSGLGNWIHAILSQLLIRWKAAESDARAEARNLPQRIDETIVRKVIEHNREQASDLLLRAMSALDDGIRSALTLLEISSILDLARLSELLFAASRISDLSAEVVNKIFQLAITYTDQNWATQQPDFVSGYLSTLRQAISTVASSRLTWKFSSQEIAIRAYFVLAKAAVEAKQKSWDEFMDPTSSSCLDMFVADKYLSSTKCYFYHLLVEQATKEYSFDCRSPILNHWLRSLLRFGEEEPAMQLTASIFKHEKDSLSMASLASGFIDLYEAPDKRERVFEVRRAAVLHTISVLYSQQDDTEADWLIGGLERFDAVCLLKTIFDTLKESWISLNERPEEQGLYTILIHAALDQYELFPRIDFTIDLWFVNAATFPQRKKRTLAKIFSLQGKSERGFLADAQEAFKIELAHAVRVDRLGSLDGELKTVLLPMVTTGITQTAKTNETLFAHASFVQAIIPPYISNVHTDPPVCSMFLSTLAHILDNLEFRIDALAPMTTRPMISACMSCLSTARSVLSEMSEAQRELVYKLARMTFSWAVALMDDLSDSFSDDIEAICDAATEDELGEGLKLLQAVMYPG